MIADLTFRQEMQMLYYKKPATGIYEIALRPLSVLSSCIRPNRCLACLSYLRRHSLVNK